MINQNLTVHLILNLSQAPESFVPVQAPITPRPVAEKAPWVAEEKSTTPEVTQSSGDKDEDDEAMSYFSKLASDD